MINHSEKHLVDNVDQKERKLAQSFLFKLQKFLYIFSDSFIL